MTTMRWKDDSDLIQALKDEIIRLGIQGNPSRTKYQEMYDRNVAPSPNSVTRRMGKSWGVLMKDLDFEYDGRKNMVEAGKQSALDKNGNSHRVERLSNPKVLKIKVDEALELINNEHITSAKEFENISTEKIGVSYSALKRNGFPFIRLAKLYEEKYGEKIIVGSKYADKSNIELLNIVVDYMKEDNLSSLYSYGKAKKPNNLPSAEVLVKRLNKGFKEVNELIKSLL